MIKIPLIKQSLDLLHQKLDHGDYDEAEIRDLVRNMLDYAEENYTDVFNIAEDIIAIAQQHYEDLQLIPSKDAAAVPKQLTRFVYPGMRALLVYRIAHIFYNSRFLNCASILNYLGAISYGVDIHPACKIGRRVFFDHSIGTVIGASSFIEDDITIYHGVTLGALKVPDFREKRHPTIKSGVTLCCHSIILGGHTVIGENSVIGAGCLVTQSIPQGTIVKKGERNNEKSIFKQIYA